MNILPTITQLFNGVIATMNAQFGITIPTQKSFLRDLATVWAGKMKVLYLRIGDVQKNVWFDLADPVALGGTLERFGESFLRRLPRAAVQGQYEVTVTGTIGATIPVNTTYLSDADSLSPNLLYILDNAFTFTGSSGTIVLRATTAGSVANLIVGNTLTSTTNLVGADSGAVVSDISVSSIDAETVDQYRAAIQTNVDLSPQGGAVADYIIWASPVSGVAKVYPYAASGAPWEIDVYIEAVLSDSGGGPPDYGYGVPTSGILADTTSAILNDPISGDGRKPLGVILGPANVGTLPVVAQQVAITFTGSTGISSDDQALIVAALQQATSKIRPFIAGAQSLADQNDTISVGLPAGGGRVAPPEDYVIIVIAMAAAPGAVFTGCSMTIDSVSYDSYTFDNGNIPYLQAANVLFT